MQEGDHRQLEKMIMTVEIAGEGSTILVPTSVTQTHDQVFKFGFSNLVDFRQEKLPWYSIMGV